MVNYDPYDQATIENPFPVYAKMRDQAPAYHLEEYGAWALSRFDDIWDVSADVEASSVAKGNTTSHLLTRVQPPSPMFALMDPPGHTSVRSAVGRLFTPRKVARLEDDVRRWVREHFDEAGDEIDIVKDLGTPIAVQVASRLIGVSDEDGRVLGELTRRFFRRDPEIAGITPDGLAAMGEMAGLFLEIIQRRRAAGGDGTDVIDTLLRVEVDGVPRSDEAIADDLVLLMNGGTDTLPKVLANTVRRLALNPETRARVNADRALIVDAFNEALRIDMPTQHLCRVLTRDRVLHGETLRTGDAVLFLYGSANRDEREFDEPERYDIERRPPRHLGFGHGAHACIGRHAATLEARMCIEELLDRSPEYAVVEERAAKLYTEFVQGFETLPVAIR